METLPIAQNHEVISLRCDNTVAVAYIKNMGGVVSRLDSINGQIWKKLKENNSFIVASYIPTKENPADALTRGVVRKKQMHDIEAQLNPRIFSALVFEGPFTPVIDWFASEENYQLERFYTWLPSQNAEGVDAFSYHWGDEPGYMFPPFSLIPRILRKIVSDKAKILLVHPDWPGALWSPTLQEITSMQNHLEATADVLRYPENPNLRHRMRDLRLAASWIDGGYSNQTRG